MPNNRGPLKVSPPALRRLQRLNSNTVGLVDWDATSGISDGSIVQSMIVSSEENTAAVGNFDRFTHGYPFLTPPPFGWGRPMVLRPTEGIGVKQNGAGTVTTALPKGRAKPSATIKVNALSQDAVTGAVLEAEVSPGLTLRQALIDARKSAKLAVALSA